MKAIQCMHKGCMRWATEIVGSADDEQCKDHYGRTHDCCGKHRKVAIK